jgi:hypothetical protein
MNNGKYGHHTNIYSLGKYGNQKFNDNLCEDGNHYNEGDHRNLRNHDNINRQKIYCILNEAEFAQLCKESVIVRTACLQKGRQNWMH